jgi:hypothetical protein
MYELQWTSLRICALAAATTSGRQWPAFTTEMPENRSVYARPFSSQTVAPSAWSTTIGWTFLRNPVLT